MLEQVLDTLVGVPVEARACHEQELPLDNTEVHTDAWFLWRLANHLRLAAVRKPVAFGRPLDALLRRVTGTRRISTSHPTALAYFFSVVTDGKWVPVAPRRETAQK